MNKKKVWHESVYDLAIFQDKVKNFYYPILPGETINFREALALKLVKFFRTLKKQNNSYYDECIISLFSIISETVNIYFTLLLKEKLELNNYKIVPDSKSRLLKNILSEQVPQFQKVLKQLIKGRENPKKRYFLFRNARNLILQKKIKKTYFKFPDFKEDIICIGDNSFLEQHAKFEKKKVYYLRLNQWFKKLDQPSGNNNDLDFVTKNILEIIFKEFNNNHIILNESLKIYFQEMIKLLLLKISIHKKSILNSEIGIPKNIWAPSGGGIFANIFRQVCKSNGSKVVGHAHGSGTGFFSDYGRTMSILEYQSCTNFFIYTKKSVEEYIKHSRVDLIVDGKLPKISSFDDNTNWHDDKLNFIEKGTFLKNENKSILYIPSIFISDISFDGKLIDAHNTYNWLLKLSNFFKKNNMNFKIKMHPSNKVPDSFLNYYKNNISKYSLAKSIQKSSLIITDQPSSSSFAASIVSNKPIIFIDLKIHDFSKNGLNLLKKRCSVINSNISNKGINLDWDLLKKLINNPLKKFSEEFKYYYFENTIN
jgi:hypothetical protein